MEVFRISSLKLRFCTSSLLLILIIISILPISVFQAPQNRIHYDISSDHKNIFLYIKNASHSRENRYLNEYSNNRTMQWIYYNSTAMLGNIRFYEVQLINGDKISVLMNDDGIIVSIGLEPQGNVIGRNYVVARFLDGLYVYPSDINLLKFDLGLFNIDYLIKEGYYKQPEIPAIIEYRVKDLINPKIHIQSKHVILYGHTKQAQLLTSNLRALGAKITEVFNIVPMISAKIPLEHTTRIFKFLAESPLVKKVWLDYKVHAILDKSASIVGAPYAWNLGINGSGVKIAILDTGIDYTHPDFYFPNGTSKMQVAISFVDGEDPKDYNGHGTHVASIAAGTGAKSGGKYKGIAPAAILWNIKVLNKHGEGLTSTVIKGIEYASLGPDGKPHTGDEANIINLSLGALIHPADGTDPLSQTVNKAVDLGVIVVAAAGNSGRCFPSFSISSPGTAEKAITVGASDKTIITNIASYSSRGPTSDLRIKPEIVAPGNGIWAACAENCLLSTRNPTIDIDGDGRCDYMMLSGTSMATPHVTGAVALLNQAITDLSPEEIKSLLVSTATILDNHTIYEQGGGLLNITAALESPIIINPAVINLKALNNSVITTISIKYNPIIRELYENIPDQIHIRLNISLRNHLGIVNNPPITFNTTELTIRINETKIIEIRVNTTKLVKAPYEGIIFITIEDEPWKGKVYHAILGFAKLNKIKIQAINYQGIPAVGRLITIFKSNYNTELDYIFGFQKIVTDWNGTAEVYLYDDRFNIVMIDINREENVTIWNIISNLSITGDKTIVLDSRKATNRIRLDLSKNMTTLLKWTGIYHSIRIGPMLDFVHIYCAWIYPPTIDTYTTNSSLTMIFSYDVYPSAYYNPDNPMLVNTPEEYYLVYSEENGVNESIDYYIDKTKLVRRQTTYAVNLPFTNNTISNITARLAVTLGYFKYPFGLGVSACKRLITAPQTRIEWYSLTPAFYMLGYYKYSDPPGMSTPAWAWYHEFAFDNPQNISRSYGEVPYNIGYDGWIVPGIDLRIGLRIIVAQDNYGSLFAYKPYYSIPSLKSKVNVYRNGALILSTSCTGNDAVFFQDTVLGTSSPINYRIIVDTTTGQLLSPHIHAEIRLNNVNNIKSTREIDFNSILPKMYLRILGININNTYTTRYKIMTARVVVKPSMPGLSVDMYYSLNNSSWKRATLYSANYSSGIYDFTIPISQSGYVSFNISVYNNKYNCSVTQIIYNATYVYVVENENIPEINLSSHSGPKGSWIQVYAEKLMPNQEYKLYFDDQLLKKIVADDNGQATVITRVPVNASPGIHSIYLKDENDELIALTEFNITLPRIKCIPDNATIGSQVIVKLEYPGENQYYQLLIDGLPVTPVITSDNPSETTLTFNVPALTSGTHNLSLLLLPPPTVPWYQDNLLIVASTEFNIGDGIITEQQLEEKIKSLNISLWSYIVKLEERIKLINATLIMVENDIKSLNTTINYINTSLFLNIRNLKLKVMTLNQSLYNILDEISILSTIINNIRANITRLSNNIDNVEAYIETKMHKMNTSLDMKLQQLRNFLFFINSSTCKLYDKLVQLNITTIELMNRVDSLSSQLDMLNKQTDETINKMQQDIDKCNSDIQQLEKFINLLLALSLLALIIAILSFIKYRRKKTL